MRSSALETLSRPCVRHVFCCLAFSLVSPLPSTASAAGFPALFSDFAGNMGLSDFPCSYITDLRSWTFSVRPPVPLTEGEHGISRFSRMKFPHVLEVSDRAGLLVHSPFRVPTCCLPINTTSSAPCLHLFSRLNTPPMCTPVNASLA